MLGSQEALAGREEWSGAGQGVGVAGGGQLAIVEKKKGRDLVRFSVRI